MYELTATEQKENPTFGNVLYLVGTLLLLYVHVISKKRTHPLVLWYIEVAETYARPS